MTTGVYGNIENVEPFTKNQANLDILADVTFAGGWVFRIEQAISHQMPREGDEILITFSPVRVGHHRVTIWRQGDTLDQYWIDECHILHNCIHEMQSLQENSLWALLPGPAFHDRSAGVSWCNQIWDQEPDATFDSYELKDMEATEDRGMHVIALPREQVPYGSVLSICGWRMVNQLHIPLLFVEIGRL